MTFCHSIASFFPDKYWSHDIERILKKRLWWFGRRHWNSIRSIYILIILMLKSLRLWTLSMDFWTLCKGLWCYCYPSRFEPVQFVGAIVEHYPSRFGSIQFVMVIDLPSSDPLQNGREWRVANPKSGYKTTGQGGVPLQYAPTPTQGQNFTQNGSQNQFCTGLEVSYSATKTSARI